MAEYTLSSRTGITPYRVGTGTHRIVTPDASTTANAGQLIKVGQVVQFDGGASSAAHRIVQASTGGSPLLSTSIVGVAAQADTSDGSTTNLGDGKRQISVWAAGGEFKFQTNISNIQSTVVNTGLALKWDSTLGCHYLVANSSAADQAVWVTEVLSPGDTNGFVAGRFFSTRVAPAIINR